MTATPPAVPAQTLPTTGGRALSVLPARAELPSKAAGVEAPKFDHTQAWLEFAATGVQATAWPITLIILVVLFRSRLSALVEKLEDFEGFGFKATFRKRLEQLNADVTQTAADAAASAEGSASTRRATEGGASEQPWLRPTPEAAEFGASAEANVLLAWEELNVFLRERARGRGIDVRRGVSATAIARDLLSNKLLTPRTVANIGEAAQLRNAVAHAKTRLSVIDALAYKETIDRLVDTISVELDLV